MDSRWSRRKTVGQGLTMAQSESPDLILMDMSLPGMNGWEATHPIEIDEGDTIHPGSGTFRTCDEGRPGKGFAGRLRRLRHQACGHPAAAG